VEIAAFRLAHLRKITCGKRVFGTAADLLLRGKRPQHFVKNPTPLPEICAFSPPCARHA
jgi:hypothetical protein